MPEGNLKLKEEKEAINIIIEFIHCEQLPKKPCGFIIITVIHKILCFGFGTAHKTFCQQVSIRNYRGQLNISAE